MTRRRRETEGCWTWKDERRVLLGLPNGAFDRYVSMALYRRWDFVGQPVTPEWEAKYLEVAAWAKRDRERERVGR